MTADPTTAVFIIDDDPTVLNSMAALVEQMGLIPVPFADATSFLAQFDPKALGCLLLDLHLPDMSGIDLQARLAEMDSSIPVILLTGQGDVSTAVQAMKQGAIDFLEKPVSPDQVRDAILKALQRDAQRRRAAQRRGEVLIQLQVLTPDERTVANLIALGHTNEDIAQQLDISLRTVQLRRASAMKKLHVKTRRELVQLVLASGIANLE
jgi:two-component system response regulator FixJ